MPNFRHFNLLDSSESHFALMWFSKLRLGGKKASFSFEDESVTSRSVNSDSKCAAAVWTSACCQLKLNLRVDRPRHCSHEAFMGQSVKIPSHSVSHVTSTEICAVCVCVCVFLFCLSSSLAQTVVVTLCYGCLVVIHSAGILGVWLHGADPHCAPALLLHRQLPAHSAGKRPARPVVETAPFETPCEDVTTHGVGK